MNIKEYTYYYFLGIGGIGMSALARYFHHYESTVLGYDKTATQLTKQLAAEGIAIHYNDAAQDIPAELNPENTLVIYTPAIPQDLQEFTFFKQQGFSMLKRSQVLGEITRATRSLAVAGTHGKTTTSTLLGHLLHFAQLPSTGFLGGIAENYQTNILLGGDQISVVEADEYDRSFLQLSPDLACITSTDADHLDIYGQAQGIEEGFLAFAQKVSSKLWVRKGINIPATYTYAVEESADFQAYNLRIINGGYQFDLQTPNGIITDWWMALPGKHNVENATVALAMAMEMGIEIPVLKEALKQFKGIKRRFTQHKSANGKVIIDDYAHHPTEINAAISAAKTFYPNQKILGVFQPHLYSRTRDFAEGFVKELSALDELILLDIYPAREKPIEGVTSEWLASQISLPSTQVVSLENALEAISERSYDVLLLMGAGNIDTLYEPLVKNTAV